MASEPKEFTRPTRNGRMTGVNITIDGETWEYVLRNAGIPIDTPLSQLKIRRYATRDKRIILKIVLDAPKIQSSKSGHTETPINNNMPQMPANAAFVSETSQNGVI